MRNIRGATWIVALACAAISCADSPTAPAAAPVDTGPALTPAAALAAESNASTRGVLASGAQGSSSMGTPANGNSGNGNAALADSADSCGAAVVTDSLASVATPGDLCAIAHYLPDAPSPGRQMVSAFIDESGGTLRLGDFEIVVPAGAVDRSTRFAILLPPPGQGDRAFAEFLPHNQEFAVPVTIRLPYAITDAQPGAPITWWSQSGKAWVDQPSAATADGRIEAQVDHFSFYGTRSRSGITIAGG